ncbi:hypothetical protein TNCT_484001 [Trichonephila clavata]|uniref:Uncharacterized protein n=1 Tax=Trichonephila clavata TaxID=2740835 RepID=A0A8X6JN15_TRICU|nr:hypothetical protein TNCT_484001 [Trichonephila clavata]
MIKKSSFIGNYEDSEIDSTKDEIVSEISVISIHEDTGEFSNGIHNASYFKKFSRFTQQNISGVTEQTSAYSTETPLAKYSKYVFYDDNGEKLIIDNAEFEEEEKEIIDIFNSNSEILPSIPFYERISYNEDYHYNQISLNASPCNSTDEDVQDNIIPNNEKLEILPSNPFYGMGSRNENYFIPIPLSTSSCNSADEDVQDNNIPNNEKLEILPSNPFYEMGSRNENNFIPIPLNASPCNSADEDAQENIVDSSKKKNFLRKVKSFFKKLRAYNSDGFTYKRFK